MINTYKGQTRTDTDKTDKTRQNKKMQVMICSYFKEFPKKKKRKTFFFFFKYISMDIKK